MTSLAGIGLYSPKQAEQLIGVDADKIRRWLFGNRLSDGPLWTPQPQERGAEDTLSFMDLLELRTVAAFRQWRISIPTIRLAMSNYRELFDNDYPLTDRRLCTDGKAVFLKALNESGDEEMIDLGKRQNVFENIITPALFESIDFSGNTAQRWHPDPSDSSIVIDPQRAFGKPIVLPSYMPTSTLFDAFKAEDEDAEQVARYFDITPEEVIRAANFEKRIAAGAHLH